MTARIAFDRVPDAFAFFGQTCSLAEALEESLSARVAMETAFAFVRVFIFFHSYFPIMPWYHAQYVLQRLTHKIYLNIIFSISIAMSSLKTMLLVKLNLTSASIPFSWSVNKLETIWALNFWQIFLLYIS